MTKDDAMFAGGMAGVLPSLWALGYAYHLQPLPASPDMAWWSFPWMLTTLAIPAVVIGAFALGGRIIFSIVNPK